MIILYWFCIFYFMFFTQTIIHETSHLIVGKILKLEIKSICIGSKKYSFKMGKLYFSPILVGGYVEVIKKELLNKTSLNVFCFFEAGAIGNMAVSLPFVMFLNNIYVLLWISVGLLIALSSNIPLWSSDMYNALVMIKEKKSKKQEYVHL